MKYTIPGFPYTEADLMRLSGRTDISRQGMSLARLGCKRKVQGKKRVVVYEYPARLIEGTDWVRVGRAVFYAEKVLKLLEKGE